MIELNEQLGRSLMSIEGFYVNNDSDTKNPLNLNLVFNGGGCIGVFPNKSGAGLDINACQTVEIDLGEFGRIVKRSLSTNTEYCELIGGALSSYHLIFSEKHKDEVGLLLEFTTGKLFVLNLGDEIFLHREMPEID